MLRSQFPLTTAKHSSPHAPFLSKTMSRKKIISLVFFPPLFLLSWIFFGWNSWNGDREAYEQYYQNPELAFSSIEFIYIYLSTISREAGLDFQSFQIVISFLTLLLFFRFFYRFTKYPLASLVFYLIFFFPLDYVLLRNTLALALVLQGLVFLVDKPNHFRMKFLAFVLLATGIHQSSIILLIFLAAPADRSIKTKEIVTYLTLTAVVYLFMKELHLIPQSIEQHLSLYTPTTKSAIAKSIFHVCSALLIAFAIKTQLRRIDTTNFQQKYLDRAQLVYNINLISIVIIFLYFESEIFIRQLRFLVFINSIFALDSMLSRRSGGLYLLLLLAWSIFILFYFLLPVSEFTLTPLFTNNIIIESL